MSRFAIRADEGFDEGVLRATRGQVEAAREALLPESPLSDELVHEARKHIKRARALLRLATGPLSADRRKSMNLLLRDAGKALSAARDRHVARRMVQDLSRNVPGEPWIDRAFDSLRAQRTDEPPPIEWVVARLEESMGGLDEAEGQRKSLRGGALRRTYRRGRDAMRAAASESRASDFHEWRKRAKDLRYQVEFLAPLWPGVLDATARDLERLTEILGEANNLSVLILFLEKAQGGEPLPQELVVRLSAQRSELWRQALECGEEIYAAKPGAYAANLKACWESSRRRREA